MKNWKKEAIECTSIVIFASFAWWWALHKSKNTEYDLVLKKITETITKINDENSEEANERRNRIINQINLNSSTPNQW